MTTLIELNKMPPGGYPYFEPAINWRNPDAFATIDVVAKNLQMARAQNPAAGLDPSYPACLQAVKIYTCTRLHGDSKYCGESDGTTTILYSSAIPQRKGCAGCGRR